MLCIIASYRGVFVGSINLHVNADKSAERGIYIHPNFWGRKLAIKICKEFYEYIRDNLGIDIITTKVLRYNDISNALERSLNAERTAEDENYYYYRRDLRDF